MEPGTRLRQTRERLGLTYRDVQRASLILARNRGRLEFVVHISRLAELENRRVVPSLHKLYALAVIYHLSPAEIFRWYELPWEQALGDAAGIPAPVHTHLMGSGENAEISAAMMGGSMPEQTGLLPQTLAESSELRGVLPIKVGPYRYGCIGTRDYRMWPMLGPGSVVSLDLSVRRIVDEEWWTEYDRPIYFVELHEGYRCGWFVQEGVRLILQTHPLSGCAPEWWKTPDEAEVVGRVTGAVIRFTAAGRTRLQQFRELRAHSSKTVR